MKVIKTWHDFEIQLNDTFGDIKTNTLSDQKISRIRFNLGEDEKKSLQRVKQALERSKKILNYCFENKSIWFVVTLWNSEESRNLDFLGFDTNIATKFFLKSGEDQKLFIYLKKYSNGKIEPTVRSIVNFEMGFYPSANITCYFINFHSKLIVNVYDDRGMDILCLNDKLLDNIKIQFSDWLNIF